MLYKLYTMINIVELLKNNSYEKLLMDIEIQPINIINNHEEAKIRANNIFNLFVIVANKEFPKLKFSISSNPPCCEIFIIGNKIVGNEYDMEMWKKVPIFIMNIHRYSVIPYDYFLDLRVNFGRLGNSSDNWKKSKADLVEIIRDSLKQAEYDFTITEENSF